jgi:predicted Zn-dependent protease
MEAFPTEIEPARLAAESLAAAHRWPEAEGVAEKWRTLAPKDAPQIDQIVAATRLYQQQPQRAIELLEPFLPRIQAQPEDDDNFALLSLYAQARIASAPPAQTVELLAPIAKTSQRCRRLWVDLTGSKAVTPATAADWLARIQVLADPKSLTDAVSVALGWAQLAQREPRYLDDAIKSVSQAASLSGSASDLTPGLLVELGTLQESIAKPADAEVNYRRAIQSDSKDAVARNNLAMIILRRGGDVTEARNLVTAAIKNHPEIPNLYDTLASIQAAQNSYPPAIENMNEALRMQPRNVAFQVNLASILAACGRRSEAKTVLGKIDDVPSDNSSEMTPELRQKLQELHASLAKA